VAVREDLPVGGIHAVHGEFPPRVSKREKTKAVIVLLLKSAARNSYSFN
jgi:hypothetical protein